MTNRGVATVLNVVLWGSGYIYAKRGVNGVFAVLAHLGLYGIFFLSTLKSADTVIIFGPILLLGSLYFAIDAYKYEVRRTFDPKQATKTQQKGICVSCGRSISPKAKFCPECGANQSESESKAS